jgi:hypothetical protein
MEDEFLNTWVMAVISYAVPVIIMGVLGLWAVRDFYDANAGWRSVDVFAG